VTAATINGVVTADMRTTVLPSSAADRTRMYAVTGRDVGGDEWLMAALRSNDGGLTWGSAAPPSQPT
jgi:hypothetical protein